MCWRADLRNGLRIVAAVASLVVGAAAAGQPADKASIPLTDATRPASVKLELLNGNISVKGYPGRDVVVEARMRTTAGARGENGKRIPMIATGLAVREDHNAVSIDADSIHRTVDVDVLVPYKASLHLGTVHGSISVTEVDGEVDADAVSGPVTLRNVSGTVVAHGLSGDLLVLFDRVDPRRPMAFSSMSGDVDVTFPPGLKATVSISSESGKVFSDFDLQPPGTGSKNIHATINGGGQTIQFKIYSGNIHIRKAGRS